MIKDLDREHLTHFISERGQELQTGRQVYSRLLRLLPARYAELVRKIRRTQNAGKARRLALMDAEYLAYLDELNELGHSNLKAKIEWDTHLLLYRCKSSRKPQG
jgi:hypothetical protein